MDMVNEITRRIREAYPDADVQLKDMIGGDHWEAMIISSAFEGDHGWIDMGIYAALGELMHGPTMR